MLDKITAEDKLPSETERGEKVNRVINDFQKTFQQFYERAAAKDKLNGLSD